MPTIAVFYGIIIKMYFIDGEHNPPHFHVQYNQYNAIVEINNCSIKGFLPQKVVKRVNKWTKLHKKQLLEMWETQNINMLPPLK